MIERELQLSGSIRKIKLYFETICFPITHTTTLAIKKII